VSASDYHSLKETNTTTTFYPGHPPRVATNVYVVSHHSITQIKNTPCWACGITYQDCARLAATLAGRAMETHHFWCEDAFTGEGKGLGGIFWPRIMADHPTFDWAGSGFDLADPATWKQFVDSEFNLQCLCSACHRAAKPVPHWLAGQADPARGGLVWLPTAGSMGIHHATYPEYRDQRHNRPDAPPFNVPDGMAQPPVPPHVMSLADQQAADLAAQLGMPGHLLVAPAA
jgi:hypothetical protein